MKLGAPANDTEIPVTNNVIRLDDYRRKTFVVYVPVGRNPLAGRYVGKVEFCEDLADAALSAAVLLFDRATCRIAKTITPGVAIYVAHGARLDGEGHDVRFLIKEEQ